MNLIVIIQHFCQLFTSLLCLPVYCPIRKHTWVYWPYAFLFQAYNLPLCTVYIFIFTECTLLPYRERDAWYDKRPWCRDSEQPVYPTAPLFSETMLQTLENNSHHVVWFLRFCKIYHLQLRKSHSITLMDPWENGQALIFMQVRIKALPKETKGNTMHTRI